MRKPAATNHRPISMMLPELVRAINSIAQGRIGQFSKISSLEARMIGELGQYGELTMISLVEIVGSDKSQVSHALKRLVAANLVRRDALRSPLKLTASGSTLAQKLQAGARAHCRLLLKGLSRTDQESFMAGISHLTQMAARLLEQEMSPGRRPDNANSGRISRFGPAVLSGAMLPEVLPARLVTLGTLLQRSSSLAFKRMTGLANTESTVLAYVWDHAPVTAKYIAQLSGRTRARIERTAALLAEANLIHRGKTHSSHDWIYERGATGSDSYKKISAEISRREEFLIRDLGVRELEKFRALLQKVAANVTEFRQNLTD
jgi:DNA-binding MarR family transcriptional regulator